MKNGKKGCCVMRVTLSNNVNFGACYKIGSKYTANQEKVANALNDMILSERQNQYIMKELESQGWDILIQKGRCINSVSLSIAKGFKVGDTRYIGLKKENVGEYYKGNLLNINDDLKDEAKSINKGSGIMEHLLGVFALVSATLLMSTGLAKCSSNKLFTDKKADITATVKKISEKQGETLNLYK